VTEVTFHADDLCAHQVDLIVLRGQSRKERLNKLNK